ncbi:MAG: biotin transporter BioY [Firmicutes bacterium]|nr:biotin transporter BioY [Bacillota bacterium]
MNSRTEDIVKTAMMTALTCVLAQIAIPMPGGVPMTLQTFAVTLAGIVLGPRLGAVSMLIYVLLGAVGVPVFAGFGGGAQILAGPTGGFLISFPIMAFLIGLGFDDRGTKGAAGISREVRRLLFLTAGTAANYAVGMLMFCVLTDADAGYAFSVCVLPFIPTTVLKAALAWVVGLRIKKAIPGGNTAR